MFQHISMSLQAGAYEETDKICRTCGTPFRGLHWTRPPCQSQRTEFVFEGRVSGYCPRCQTAWERHAAWDARRRAVEVEPAELRRPVHVPSDPDDPPF